MPRIASVGGCTLVRVKLLDDVLRARHGVVTREQLLGTGLSANTVGSWLQRGRLTRVLPCVYAKTPLDRLTRVNAALLWLPTGAASHRTAAWLWQMMSAPDVVELTVPRGCSRRSPVPWLRLHRRDLPADRIELCGHLPVVEPEQTVLDCLAVLDESAGGRLVDTALCGLAQLSRLRGRYLDNLGRRGSAAAARQLPQAVPGAASHPERVLVRALRDAGMTGFRVNAPVRGYVADLLDDGLRLIIEVDGWAAHGRRDAFQKDRTRQNHLVAAGYTVLRYTATDVELRLPACVTQIKAMVDSLIAQQDRRK